MKASGCIYNKYLYLDEDPLGYVYFTYYTSALN